MYQQWLNEQDDAHKVFITSMNPEAPYEVQAPLPDGFGMTVGSEYSTPFDTGSMTETMQKVFAVAGIAQKQGIRMRKMFTNAEHTEFSFDMEFVTYYNPIEEVLKPVYFLSLMTLGRRLAWEDVGNATKKALETISNLAKEAANVVGVESDDAEPRNATQDAGDAALRISQRADENNYTGTLLELINIVRSPPKVIVQMGRTMKWEDMFITSMAVQFSNVLSHEGLPMSARVTVTVTPERYPIADDMASVFSMGQVRDNESN